MSCRSAGNKLPHLLFENVLILPSFLKCNFPICKILRWTFFPLSTLYRYFFLHMLMILSRSQLLFLYFYLMCPSQPLPVIFKLFSLSLFVTNVVYVLSLVFFLLDVHWVSWACELIFFMNLENNWGHHFFKYIHPFLEY